VRIFEFSKKIKISFDDKRIFLINTNHLLDFDKKKFLVIIYNENKFNEHFDEFVINGKVKHIVFVADDFTTLFKSFKSHFKNIKAAGGLVINEKKQILMIFRRSKWDLPKGKVEENETIEQAAVREVEEETGIKVDSLKELLKTTFHIYLHNGKYCLKENYWFKMKSHSKYPLTPQVEEDIEKIEWVDSDNIDKYLEKSFPSIKDVLKD
jgi:8-oxo-dGTP pyrophosphatase MutT (NUDIX family)